MDAELPVSHDWLEMVLSNHQRRLVSTKTERFAEKLGWVSKMYRVGMIWSDRQQFDETAAAAVVPESVVLKVMTTERFDQIFPKDANDASSTDHHDEIIEQVHGVECAIYQFFSSFPPTARPVPIARCYHTQPYVKHKHPGILVLEDLTSKARTLRVDQGTLTLQQCLNVVEALARLHAFCWTDSSWRENVSLPKTVYTSCKIVMARLEPTIHKVVEQFKHDLTVTAQDVLKLDGLNLTMQWEADNNNQNENRLAVIVHGDLWNNNILFEFNPTDNQLKDELIAIVDWQVARIGCCTEDIARLMTSSVSIETRRQHQTDILRHYYKKLQEYIGNNADAVVPYSFEKVLELYQYFMRQSAMVLFYFLPAMVAAVPDISAQKKVIRRLEATVIDTLKYHFPQSYK